MIQSQMVSAAVRSDGWDDVQVKDGNDEEEDEIAASESADQMRMDDGLGGGGQDSFAGCTTAGSSPGCARFGMTKAFLTLAGKAMVGCPT
jgi:hypothetical protein